MQDQQQDADNWHPYRASWWWGVRLIDGRKVRGCQVMRRRVSTGWQYREVLFSDARSSMRADLAKRLVKINR